MNDPFQVLGISPSATEDEIKQAYRRLAKKYHPDLNPGDAAAEAKMKEINEAYTMAIKMKKGGYTAQQAWGNQQRQNPYGQQGNPYGQQWGPFGGYGAYQQRSQTYTYTHRSYADPQMQAASDYIQTGRYHDAIRMLNDIAVHDAAWHFLFSLANIGIGNRVAALNSARQAAQMEPDNAEYRSLLQQLEYSSYSYQQAGGFGGIRTILCSNPCISCCLCNTLLNCCCRMGRC